MTIIIILIIIAALGAGLLAVSACIMNGKIDEDKNDDNPYNVW